jgi:hypothetical protein
MPTTPPCPIVPIYETVTLYKRLIDINLFKKYIFKFPFVLESMQISYRLETYLVTVTSVDCPAEHLICCEGFTMLSGQCIGESLFNVKLVKQSLISSFVCSCFLCAINYNVDHM